MFYCRLLDIEEMLGKVKWGGVKIGERKCYTLEYADDLVLMMKGKKS